MDKPGASVSLLSSWFEAELLAAEHMRSLGFDDAETTVSGSDGGIDVRATGAAAQVKHYSSAAIGRPALQALKGAVLTKRQLIFYALNGYTTAAVSYATEASIALFSYDLNGAVRPVNEAAERLTLRRHVSTDVFQASVARIKFLSNLQAYGQQVADAIRVLIYLVTKVASSELAAINNGSTFYGILTPDNVWEIQNELVVLGERQMAMGRDELRPLGVISDEIISTEALAQKLSRRFKLDYGLLAAIGEKLRVSGAIEQGEAEVARQIELQLR